MFESSTEPKPPLFRSAWGLAFVYYAIACGWAWLAWSPVVLGSDGLKIVQIRASLPIFSCIATLGPFFGCFIAHRLETGSWRAVRLLPGRPHEWPWLVLGPLLVLISFFVVFPAFISKGSPANWHWHPAVLIGLWVPMFNYDLFGGPLVVGLSLLMAYGFNSSGRAVVVAILMHSAFNASSRFLDPFLDGTPTRQRPSPEMFIAFAFWALGILAVLFTRGGLNATPAK